MYGMTLDEMRNVDIRTVNPKELVDINDVIICPEKTIDERIRDFIHQVRNPYCYRVGRIAVKVSFSEDGAPLEETLESILAKF